MKYRKVTSQNIKIYINSLLRKTKKKSQLNFITMMYSRVSSECCSGYNNLKYHYLTANMYLKFFS